MRERDGVKGRWARTGEEKVETGTLVEFGFTSMDEECHSHICPPNSLSDPP